jgi:hypothetical protein
MGFSHEAYVAYGVRIPVHPYRSDGTGRTPGEQVDQALSVPTVKAACPDVGHLEAGDYDRDSFFLVTKCESAGYTPKFISDLVDSTENEELSWERQLLHLIEIMGWNSLADAYAPGWFVVADCS